MHIPRLRLQPGVGIFILPGTPRKSLFFCGQVSTYSLKCAKENWRPKTFEKTMMAKSISAYLHTSGLGAAIPNMVINPVLAWLTNPQMESVPLTGSRGIATDTAITSIILSLVVTLFMVSQIRRDLEAGHIMVSDGLPGNLRLLSYLPRQGWALGLTIGVLAALILTSFTEGLFSLLGATNLPFVWFALFKALYTPALAFLVARWAILRQLELSLGK